MRISLESQRAWLIAALLITLGIGIGIVSCEALRQWRTSRSADGLPPACYGPDALDPACPPSAIP